MGDEQSPRDLHVERVDADAVCAECGTVNPEDTLLCKTCGNNLRDQRARRVAAEAAETGEVSLGERRGWLGKGLTVLVILVTVWVALNVRKIERWLVEIQAPAQAFEGQNLWQGPDAAVYEGLLADLRDHPVTNGEAAAALEQAGRSMPYDGRYILAMPATDPRTNAIGYAEVRQEGETLYLVAELNSGAEIRGTAVLEADNRPTARETAGVRIGRRYYGALGVAYRSEAGGYECFVHSQASDASYRVLAYRVP